MKRRLNPPTARGLACLALLVLGLSMATSAGHLFVQDEVSLFYMTSSYLERGSFSIPHDTNTGGGFRGLDGRYYSPYGIGQPILAAPWLGCVRLLLPRRPEPYLQVMGLAFFNQAILAATAAALALLLLELGASWRLAIAAALACCFGTHCLIYARTFFSEPLTGLLGLLALRSLLWARRGRGRHALWAGLFAGYSVWVRFFGVLLLPVQALVLLLPGHDRSRGERWWQALAFSGIAGGFVAVCLYRNWTLTGHWLDSGYRFLPDGRERGFTHPLGLGLAILLLSPGKSLLLFAPPLMAGLACWRSWWRAQPWEALLLAALAGIYLVGYATWCSPEGGNTWGPRLLVPLVPLGFVPLAFGGESIRRLLAWLAAAGLALQLLALPVDFAQRAGARAGEYYTAQGDYNFWFSPFRDHLEEAWRVLGQCLPTPQTVGRNHNMLIPDWRGEPDLWFIHALREGHPLAWVLPLLGAQLGLALVGALRVRELWRNPGGAGDA